MEGLYVERRGRATNSKKGRPPKLDKKIEEDLIAENQRLRMEIDYLKKLNALVQERELREKKRTKSARTQLFAQTVDMLEKAFAKIPDNTNLIFHSDQGWQYQVKKYQRMLADKGVRQSMSRKGNCLDNAVMENFFGHLKSELFYLQDFDNVEHFIAELDDYMDYYNNRRIKAKLKGLSPVQYRNQAFV